MRNYLHEFGSQVESESVRGSDRPDKYAKERHPIRIPLRGSKDLFHLRPVYLLAVNLLAVIRPGLAQAKPGTISSLIEPRTRVASRAELDGKKWQRCRYAVPETRAGRPRKTTRRLQGGCLVVTSGAVSGCEGGVKTERQPRPSFRVALAMGVQDDRHPLATATKVVGNHTDSSVMPMGRTEYALPEMGVLCFQPLSCVVRWS